MLSLNDALSTASRTARQLVKRSVTALANRHRPGEENDVLILSSPRSGSTWLMELLYTQPGMKYINEPLTKHILDAEGIFPLQPRWRYVTLDTSEKRAVADFLKNDRLVRRFGPRDVLADEYDFRTNRRVLKLIRACALLPWFAEANDFDVIYLIRHPIAQALSAIRRGHEHHLEAYRSTFPPETYGDEAERLILDLDASKSNLETFVAAWCLENVVPLQYVSGQSDANVFVLTYEELVLNPDVVLNRLAANLRLNHVDRMMAQIATPSAVTDSTPRQTRDRIREGDRRYLVRKWKDQVSEAQEEKVFAILDAFGIGAYRPGRFAAQERFLHGAGED